MKQLLCAICGQKEKTSVLYASRIDKKNVDNKTFSARRTPDRIHYRFLECHRCGLIFSSPIFEEKEITNLYQQSTFDYMLEAEYLRQTYGKYLQQVLSDMSSPLKLLDIGCGNGFFLEEAKKIGVREVYGVEPGEKAVQKAPNWLQKRITVAMYDKEIFPKNYFNIITCFHTLDHIIDPNVFLDAVHKQLKKRGKVLFIVHNTKGLSVKLFGEKSPIFDIEHIYLFDKTSLKTIFKYHGFRNIKVFDVVNTYPLIYWFRMLPLPSIVKSFVMNFLKNTFLGQLPLTIPAGNIGIIAEK